MEFLVKMQSIFDINKNDQFYTEKINFQSAFFFNN